MENLIPGVAYSVGMGRNSAEEGNDIIGKFNPGLGAQSFDIDGSAKLIPKGSDFVFELHYTATGKPETDTSRVGLGAGEGRSFDLLLHFAGHPRRHEPRYSGESEQCRSRLRIDRRR